MSKFEHFKINGRIPIKEFTRQETKIFHCIICTSEATVENSVNSLQTQFAKLPDVIHPNETDDGEPDLPSELYKKDVSLIAWSGDGRTFDGKTKKNITFFILGKDSY